MLNRATVQAVARIYHYYEIALPCARYHIFATLGAAGVLLGAPGVLLGAPGTHLAWSWMLLGAPGVFLGCSWVPSGGIDRIHLPPLEALTGSTYPFWKR